MKPAAIVSKDGTKRDIDDIPDATIDKVVLQIVNEQIAIPLDGIKLAANRMLGYQRRTTRIDNAITRSVARLISAKQILRDGDTLKAI